MSLKNKTIVITGASSGIGKEMAKQCAQKNANVILIARSEDILLEMKQLLAKVGANRIDYYVVDVSQREEVVTVFQKIKETFQTIDILINNAGFGIFESFIKTTPEEMEEMFQVNVFGVFYCTQEALKIMRETNKGHIITTASIAGKMATAKSSVYAATKHAVIGMMNALRLELSKTNIKITVVNPGPIQTNFFKRADRSKTYERSVERYLLNPEDVAKRVISTIYHPRREINLPWYMGVGAKVYQVAPHFTEWIGGDSFKMK